MFTQGKISDDKGLWSQAAGSQCKLQAAGCVATTQHLAGFLQGFGGGAVTGGGFLCQPLFVPNEAPGCLLSQLGGLLSLLKQCLSWLKFCYVLFH
nr:hypothetical protein [Xenorhabdus bovienii]